MPATTWNDVVKAVKAKMPDASLKDVLKAASPEWKRIKSGKNPTKGMASLTMSGKEDFSTKKTSKVFHRKGHYEDESVDGVKRRPYHNVGKRSSKKPRGRTGKKAVSKLPMSESVLMVEESPMAGGQAATDASPEPDQAANVPAPDVSTEVSELAQETTGSADPSSAVSLLAPPGMPTTGSVTDPEPSQVAQSGGRRRRRKGGRRTAKKSHRRRHRKGGRRTAKKSHRRRHRK